MVTNVPSSMVTDGNNDKATRTKKIEWIGSQPILHDSTPILWFTAGLAISKIYIYILHHKQKLLRWLEKSRNKARQSSTKTIIYINKSD